MTDGDIANYLLKAIELLLMIGRTINMSVVTCEL